VFHAIRNWIARGRIHPDPAQLDLAFDGAPRTAEEMLAILKSRGLKRIERCSLTQNARVMVSFRGTELRIHQSYLGASPEVLDAIVRLVGGRTKSIRREAGKFIVANGVTTGDRSPRRQERMHPDDAVWTARLVDEHLRLNAVHFGNTLAPIVVRVSRRMKSRLGHYSPAERDGPAEIAISRRHIRRHGWDDALETLLHEMVHQWQAETGAPLDHGPAFRRKAREVGIRPRAKRDVS
jgi:SprT-like family